MRLSFDSIEEVKAFVAELKGTRGGKGKDKDDAGETGPAVTGAVAGQAPAPMLPAAQAAPNGGAAFTGFAPPAAGAGPGPGFGAPAAQAAPAPATGPSPEVAALVARIGVRLDAALASGQPQDVALNWFRTECGPLAAQATFEQIKTHHLFQQPMDKLAHIAKVMNA